MDLYGENQFRNSKVNDKKIIKIIIILMAILLFLAIGIVCTIYYLKNKELKVYIDEKNASSSVSLFSIEDDDVYVSISGLAKKLGYTKNNGEYKHRFDEDTSKCYVDNNYETASYILGSNTMYKKLIDKTDSSYKSDYEYFTLKKPVKQIDGELYTTLEGAEKGFNFVASYNSSNNTIKIYTLQYLLERYTSKTADAVKIDDLSYENKKAVLYDMILVQNETGKLGVNKVTGETIIGKKYRKITFIESSQEFLVVTDDGKVGIIDSNAQTRIEPLYNSINLINEETGLYIVSKDNKYGIVNKKGQIVVYLEYDSIGLEDARSFAEDDIENDYLLYNKYIPVKKDQKWGLLDVNGNSVMPVEYDSLGCNIINSKDTSINSVLLIPEYEAIVVCKDKLYGIFGPDYYKKTGKMLIEVAVDNVYSIISGGNKEYYLTYQGNRMHVINYIKTAVGVQPINEENNNNPSNSNANNENTTTNQQTNTENSENNNQTSNSQNSAN